MRSALLTFPAAALAALALSCARQHLTPTQGQSYDAAFAAQRAPLPPASAKRGAAVGLDSQEAEIIADSYRRSLAPKDEKPNEEPIIIVPPPTQGGYQRAPALAPSVPK